jgi:glycine cleavage system H lipoate-binding protein
MNQDDNIVIYNKGYIHLINKEPYETNEDVFKRGWFIVINKDNEKNMNKLISMSIITNNIDKGMVY